MIIWTTGIKCIFIFTSRFHPVNLLDHKTSIINVYRPPQGDLNEFIHKLKHIKNNITTKHIIVGGDFNIDQNNTFHHHTMILNDAVTEMQMAQKIFSDTRITSNSSSLIDNIYCNESISEGKICLTDISDHLGIFIQPTYVKSNTVKKCAEYIPFHDTSAPNLKKLNDAINNIDWPSELSTENPCSTFMKIFKDLFNTFCPVVTKKKFNKNLHPKQPWMTNGLIISRKSKQDLRKAALLNKTNNTWDKYILFRQIYNKTIKAAKLNHMTHIINENQGNSKVIWSTINEYINRHKNDAPLNKLRIGDTIITEKKDIANKFNEQFSTIGKQLAATCQQFGFNDNFPQNKKQTQLFFQEVNSSEISSIINQLKPKKSTGYDNVSNYVVKCIRASISIPLTIIINHGIRTKEFPDEFKIAKVMPIFKKGDTESMTNYRPISLLPTFSKVFEKVIEKQLRQYMYENNYLSKNQFGFRKNHETSHIVMAVQDSIKRAKSKGLISLAIFLDLSKAFDTICHSKLLNKIRNYGIDDKLIKSYLYNRRQYTVIDGHKSKKRNITYGVPQGSILGPLFFIIFLNNFENAIDGNVFCFADDTTILLHEKTIDDLITMSNKALKTANRWFNSNSLTINADKTNYIVFNTKETKRFNGKLNLGSTILQRIGDGEKMKATKFVGLWVDEKLTWKYHIQELIKKINYNIFLIASNKNVIPLTTRKTLYNSFVLPFINYGVQCWGFKGKKAINGLQKKCIRHIINTPNYIAHTDPILAKLNFLKFEDIMKQKIATIGYKFLNNTLAPGLQHMFNKQINRTNTRTKKDIVEVTPKAAHEEQEIRFTMPKIWNALPTTIKEANTVNNFKYKYKQYCIINYATFKCEKNNCPSCSVTRPNF